MPNLAEQERHLRVTSGLANWASPTPMPQGYCMQAASLAAQPENVLSDDAAHTLTLLKHLMATAPVTQPQRA